MAFSTALSGLTAASSDLDVTANNIANADTVGFKESRACFVFPPIEAGDGAHQQFPGRQRAAGRHADELEVERKMDTVHTIDAVQVCQLLRGSVGLRDRDASRKLLDDAADRVQRLHPARM